MHPCTHGTASGLGIAGRGRVPACLPPCYPPQSARHAFLPANNTSKQVGEVSRTVNTQHGRKG
jgi:hypothetical protein